VQPPTRCQILRRFPLGLRPRPRWGSLQAPPDSLAVFKKLRRPTSKERGGRGNGKGRGRKGGGEGKGKKGVRRAPHFMLA